MAQTGAKLAEAMERYSGIRGKRSRGPTAVSASSISRVVGLGAGARCDRHPATDLNERNDLSLQARRALLVPICLGFVSRWRDPFHLLKLTE
jgi:hypothetical protein